MSFASLDGLPVSSGHLSVPRIGRPTAELKLAVPTEEAPAKGAQLELEFEDGTRYHMTVLQSGSDGSWARVLLAGGMGGMSKTLPSRFYQGVPASLVIGDILREAGERIASPGPDTLLLEWTRQEGSAYRSLQDLLAGLPGYVWRVLPDGAVSILRDRWPVFEEVLEIIAAHPQRQCFELPIRLDLSPGVELEGWVGGVQTHLGRVERVIHRIGERLRTEVYTGPGLGERLIDSLQVLTVPDRYFYRCLFPAKVLADHGDMHLDLRPDNRTIPDLVRVPLRLPMPGAFVKVKPGARVLLAFEGGDPAAPAAHLWQTGSLAVFEVATPEGYRVRLDAEAGAISLLSPLASVVVRGGEVEVAGLSVSVNAPSIQLGGEAAVLPVAVYGPGGLQPSVALKGI